MEIQTQQRSPVLVAEIVFGLGSDNCSDILGFIQLFSITPKHYGVFGYTLWWLSSRS
jgi:hypothetical protein